MGNRTESKIRLAEQIADRLKAEGHDFAAAAIRDLAVAHRDLVTKCSGLSHQNRMRKKAGK